MDEPRTYSTKSDFAYDMIRNRILTHDYAPGTRINQAALAKEIGISTTPLREALRRLKQEGLVELDAHRDALVTELSTEEARDLLELRLALDPMAAGLAAERRTHDDIAVIRKASEVNALSNNPTVVDLVAHRRFHRAIYTASHNDMLISTLDGLWDKADRYRLLGLKDGRDQPERNLKDQEHQQIMAAVIAGDSDTASAVMRTHIEGSLGAKATWMVDRSTSSA